MNKKLLIGIGVVALVAILLWGMSRFYEQKPINPSHDAFNSHPPEDIESKKETSATNEPRHSLPQSKSMLSKSPLKENPNPTDQEWKAAGIDPSKIEKPLPLGKRTIWSIAEALRGYHQEFRDYPHGNSNKEIADAIFGKNPKKLIFLENSRRHGFTNEHGDLVDPWGTPYQFTFTGDKFEIWSAGADRSFGTDDDEIYPEPLKQSLHP